MGSDKVRIADAKYMKTLMQKLNYAEQKAWLKRSKFRKKVEVERSRALIIEGLTEPGRDMMALHNHPVFRYVCTHNHLRILVFQLN